MGTGTTGTITFTTTHLTTFAASSKQNSGDSGGGGNGGGGGGCSITSTDHNMSVGSIVVNALVFFLPFIVFGIKRKCDAGSLEEKK